ncbi:MAG: nucleotide exchange factor GrpE [Sedimentisphaerales bacterium]|nr:nucleotide exchange factor GrpE [Sedimentisphaerales bacterium]
MKHKEKEKPKEPQEPKAETKAESGGLEELRKQLENLQKEKDEIFGQLQRVSADYINYQKRVSRQTADTIAYEKEKIIKTLLPALDNFEHTLQNAASAENKDVLLKGIKIIYDQILDILKSHGVERIDALGAKFDPAFHEAVSQKADPEKKENTIIEEFQKGYKLNDRVIRPSRVIVNKLTEQGQAKQQPADDETIDLNAETIDLADAETIDLDDDETDTGDERRETSDD